MTEVPVGSTSAAAVGRSPEVGGTTPYATIHHEGSLSLRRYDGDGDRAPVLLVYAVFNRPDILDLAPGRSVVRRFLDAGHPVYLVDWGRPSRLDATLGLDDFVGRYLANVVEATTRIAGSEPHVVGYSTGGTLAIAHAALDPESIRSLSLLGTPVAFDGIDDGLYGIIGASDTAERLVTGSGLVDGDLLALSFSLAAPFEFYLGRYIDAVTELSDPEALTARLKRFAWSGDTIDVPEALLMDLIDLFRSNALIDGTLRIRDRPIGLDAIDVPVAALVGTDDRFVPRSSTERALDAVSSSEVATFTSPTGHVGLAADAVSHERLWPSAIDWIGDQAA